jgi:hypothetical protein
MPRRPVIDGSRGMRSAWLAQGRAGRRWCQAEKDRLPVVWLPACPHQQGRSLSRHHGRRVDADSTHQKQQEMN